MENVASDYFVYMILICRYMRHHRYEWQFGCIYLINSTRDELDK